MLASQSTKVFCKNERQRLKIINITVGNSKMAVHFKTDNPQGLLNLFKKAITDKTIVTWSHKDGYFTHDTSTDQWKGRAWFLPKVQSGYLTMNIIKPQDSNITSEVYAVYHGRLIEAMLAHFDKQFSNATATALPETGDLIS